MVLGFDLTPMAFLPPAPQWSVDQIPDLSGKVIVVTGANAGLGQLSAQILLQHGARVYAACRSREKAEKAIEEIKKKTGKDDIHFLSLDLSDIPSCLRAANELSEKESRLDVALLSAGVMMMPKGSKSAQGLEMQFATNVVGHYAFVQRLEPLLIKTAESAPTGSVRVVWVSSSAHHLLAPKDGIHYDEIDKVTVASPDTYYGYSKLGNVYMANAMAERLRSKGVISVSLHPGNIQTDLQRHLSGVKGWVISKILHPVEKGVLTQLYAATSPDLTMEDTGSYLIPWARKYPSPHKKAKDPAAITEAVSYVDKLIEKHGGGSTPAVKTS